MECSVEDAKQYLPQVAPTSLDNLVCVFYYVVWPISPVSPVLTHFPEENECVFLGCSHV